jgi:hypothetical protein
MRKEGWTPLKPEEVLITACLRVMTEDEAYTLGKKEVLICI